MRLLLFLAIFLCLTIPVRAEHQPRCYASVENPDWTLTDGSTKQGAGFVWMQGKKRIELTVGGIGTGIVASMATEENGKVHTYLYVRDILILDMVPYEPGCPNDRTWVDKDCKRVLISQANAWSELVAYYFIDGANPVTDCWVSDLLEDGPVHDLECSSGRRIKLDTRDLTRITVDGVEMRTLDTGLPCSGNFGQP
jgi:hypothetical protein